MTINPEASTGVGETQEKPIDRTPFRDYLADTLMLLLELTASDEGAIASTHGLEFPYAHMRGQDLRKAIARIDIELKEAGYTDDDIKRIAKSKIEPVPHDPTKPRTNT